MKSKKELVEELKEKWENLHWPKLPPFESDLNKPACELMEQDTFIAGCLSQIIQTGTLDKKLWPVLVIDQELTDRIAATHDPRTQEFLEYKMQLDECTRLAQMISQQEKS